MSLARFSLFILCVVVAVSTSPVSEVCPDEDDFLCISDGYSSCFPNSWKCDGEPDCDGNVDEQGCRKYFSNTFNDSVNAYGACLKMPKR
uniref:Uncharacterized protein n=1 Tax=Magallana gigas TaxID=29159 RepID=A0A8W8LMC0_MAGGI